MEKNKKNKLELTEKITGKAWEDALKKAYEKNNKKAKIAGFRPGKAPYDVFIKHYGVESLFIDAADLVVQEAYLKAIEEKKVIPVCEPTVNIKNVSEKEIEFTFGIVTKPELTIKKYKDYTKKLTENDKSRLKNLLGGEFDEVINYMLKNDCKLEQEAVELSK